MGTSGPRPVVLDAGAFIAFEKNDRRVCRLIEMAVARRAPLHAPAGVIGQIWRDGRRQARLTRFIQSGAVVVRALDLEEAQAAGALCGSRGTKDIVDASVALLASRTGGVVVTSDPDDLKRVAPQLQLIMC